MKTPMSRFQIHDDLTAPEGSVPGTPGRACHRRSAAELPRSPRGLPGGAARLRPLPLGAPSRPVSRLPRSSASPWPWPSTTGQSRESPCMCARHVPPAWGSTRWPSPASSTATTWSRPRCCATSRRSSRGRVAPMHLHEEAREAGWTDEQILEAIAYCSLEELHGDDQRGRRGAGRRLRGGVPHPARRLMGASPAATRRSTTTARADISRPDPDAPATCPLYHEAIELVGGAGRGRSSTRSSSAHACASPRSASPYPRSPISFSPSA